MKGFADVFRLPPPAKQPCELVAILERVVALISARPDAGGIAWRWELDAPAIRVSADPAQLEQAILNVVKNAVEAVDGTGGRSRSAPRRRRIRRRWSSRTAAPG